MLTVWSALECPEAPMQPAVSTGPLEVIERARAASAAIDLASRLRPAERHPGHALQAERPVAAGLSPCPPSDAQGRPLPPVYPDVPGPWPVGFSVQEAGRLRAADVSPEAWFPQHCAPPGPPAPRSGSRHERTQQPFSGALRGTLQASVARASLRAAVCAEALQPRHQQHGHGSPAVAESVAAPAPSACASASWLALASQSRAPSAQTQAEASPLAQHDSASGPSGVSQSGARASECGEGAQALRSNVQMLARSCGQKRMRPSDDDPTACSAPAGRSRVDTAQQQQCALPQEQIIRLVHKVVLSQFSRHGHSADEVKARLSEFAARWSPSGSRHWEGSDSAAATCLPRYLQARSERNALHVGAAWPHRALPALLGLGCIRRCAGRAARWHATARVCLQSWKRCAADGLRLLERNLRGSWIL